MRRFHSFSGRIGLAICWMTNSLLQLAGDAPSHNDMRVVPIPLMKARLFMTKCIRLSALVGLARLRSAVNRARGTELGSLTREVKLTIGLCCLILIVASTARARVAEQDAHVFGNPHVWHWAPSRTYHVVNYELKLRFDEPKGEVFGDEVVTLRPFEPHFQIGRASCRETL